MQIPDLTVDLAPAPTGRGVPSTGAPAEGFVEALADLLGEVDELTMAIAAAGMVASPLTPQATPLPVGGTAADGAATAAAASLTAGIDAGTERLLASLMVGAPGAASAAADATEAAATAAATAATATTDAAAATTEDAAPVVVADAATDVVGIEGDTDVDTDTERPTPVGHGERPGIERAAERAPEHAAVVDLPLAPPAHGHDRIGAEIDVPVDDVTPPVEEAPAPVATTPIADAPEPVTPAMPAIVEAASVRDNGPANRAETSGGRTPVSQIDRSLVDAVRQLREGREESRHMVLQLDPPELGSVNVRLIARGGARRAFSGRCRYPCCRGSRRSRPRRHRGPGGSVPVRR